MADKDRDHSAESALVRDSVNSWLKTPNLCGCWFAKTILLRQNCSVLFEIADLDFAAHVSSNFAAAAVSGNFPLAIFPRILNEAHLKSLLEVFGAHPHWRLEEFARDSTTSSLELCWQSPVGHWCNIVGFAPFSDMPVTRRAPFVALGCWPGGHDNCFLKAKKPISGLADCAHQLSQE